MNRGAQFPCGTALATEALVMITPLHLLGNAQREYWQTRQSRQRIMSNLHILNIIPAFESHPHRQKTINDLTRDRRKFEQLKQRHRTAASAQSNNMPRPLRLALKSHR